MGSALCGTSQRSAAEESIHYPTEDTPKVIQERPETPPLQEADTSTNCLQSQLIAMGFEPNSACLALMNNDNDLELAVQWLCENPDCASSNANKNLKEENAPPQSREDVNQMTPRSLAKSILSRERQGLLEPEEHELAAWSRKVKELQSEERKRRISGAEAARQWLRLERQLPDIQTRLQAAQRKSQLAGALRRAGEDTVLPKNEKIDEVQQASEIKMANLLRRADNAHHLAEGQRDEVTLFCRSVRPQIDTTSLEKVYLFLKDKVHNKEKLDEDAVRETIFGQYEICEATGTDLVPKLLELILVEEDALLLKRLINALFSNGCDHTQKDNNDSDEQLAKDEVVKCWRKRYNNTHDADTEDAQRLSKDLDIALRRSYEIVQASLTPEDRADLAVDLALFDKKSKEADAALRDRIQSERQAARKALQTRLASRKKARLSELQRQGIHGAALEAQAKIYDESAKRELADFDHSDEAETVLNAAAKARDKAIADMSRRRAAARTALRDRLARRGTSPTEDEERLFNASEDAAANAKFAGLDRKAVTSLFGTSSREDELDRGRRAAREALKARLLKRKGKSQDDELRRFDERFDTVTKAITKKNVPPEDASAADILKRLAAEQRNLERRLAAERAQRSEALQRRRRELAASSVTSKNSNTLSDEESISSIEIKAMRKIQLDFAEQVLSFTVSKGREVDPAAVAALLGTHEDALTSLSETLDKRAAMRRAALSDRKQRRREEAHIEQERSAELARLLAEQRAQLLQVIELDDEHSESLLLAYKAVAPKPEAVEAVLDGVRSAVENDVQDQASLSPANETSDESKDEKSAASLIHNHARETARVHAEFESEREHQRAALRQRLAARFSSTVSTSSNPQEQCVCDEMEDWAILEKEANESEVKGLAKAHAVFCGQALGVVGGDLSAVATLVSEHETAASNLSAELAKKHAKRREALLQQLQKRHATSKVAPPNIGDQVAAAFEALDAELQAERRDELRALMKMHQAAVLQALAGGEESSLPTTPTAKPDLRAQFLSLCDDETNAAEQRRKTEASNVSRQRAAIERRLAARRRASSLASPLAKKNTQDTSFCSDVDMNTCDILSTSPQVAREKASIAGCTSLVAQIQQARRRQVMTHQLHTNRQNQYLTDNHE